MNWEVWVGKKTSLRKSNRRSKTAFVSHMCVYSVHVLIKKSSGTKLMYKSNERKVHVIGKVYKNCDFIYPFSVCCSFPVAKATFMATACNFLPFDYFLRRSGCKNKILWFWSDPLKHNSALNKHFLVTPSPFISTTRHFIGRAYLQASLNFTTHSKGFLSIGFQYSSLDEWMFLNL